MMVELSDKEFKKYSEFIYEKFGINLNESKREMVQARLRRLLSKYNIETYDELYHRIVLGKERNLWIDFQNEITINETYFFREIDHFNYLKSNMDFIMSKNKRIHENREIRVWSSACSSGEEPYSIAITLKQALPEDYNIKILATDLSEKVLAKAVTGKYSKEIKKNIDPFIFNSYFDLYEDGFRVKNEIKDIITFRRFNLMNKFPFKNTFDIIFCRNVMIYFDVDTQQELVNKFYHFMHKGSLLFIGHSESLSYRKHNFEYIKPTVYMKKGE